MTGPSSRRPDISNDVNVTRKPLKRRKIWMVPLALGALMMMLTLACSSPENRLPI